MNNYAFILNICIYIYTFTVLFYEQAILYIILTTDKYKYKYIFNIIYINIYIYVFVSGQINIQYGLFIKQNCKSI